MRLVEKIKQWKAMPAEERSAKASAVLKNVAKYFFAKTWPLWLFGIALSSDAPSAVPPQNVKTYLRAEMSYAPEISCEDACRQMCTFFCQSIYQENQAAETKAIKLEDTVEEAFGKMIDNEDKVLAQEDIVKRINKYDWFFERYAEMYGIPEHKNTLKAVAYVESKGRHTGIVVKRLPNGKKRTHYISNAVTTSEMGAKGIMQLMPATAREMGINPSNIYQNIMGAAKLLSLHLEKYNGNIALALYAYNAGEMIVDSRLDEAGSEDAVVHEVIARDKVNDYAINVLAAKKLFDRYDEYLKGKDKIITEKE